MTKNIDMFWTTNKDWWDVIRNKQTGEPEFIITDDAPEEAKKSFANYQMQCEERDKKYL